MTDRVWWKWRSITPEAKKGIAASTLLSRCLNLSLWGQLFAILCDALKQLHGHIHVKRV